MLIDLSPTMLARIKNYNHPVDRLLLSECAYYPRAGCQDCSFDQPLSKCKFSHILIDTRITSPVTSQVKSPLKSKQKDDLWHWKQLLSTLPSSAQAEVRKLMKEVR